MTTMRKKQGRRVAREIEKELDRATRDSDYLRAFLFAGDKEKPANADFEGLEVSADASG